MGVAITYAQIAMPVAKEAGFFEEQGLDAEVIFGSRAPTALLAGEVQFAGGAVDDVIVANLSGGNLAVIGSMVSTLQHKFLARPEIQSGADLRGKPVGVSKRGSLTHTVARMAAKRGGLDPERDVTIIELGDTAAQLAAMANGAIYGTALVPPSIEVAERNGAHVLYDFPAEKIEYTVASLATSRDWAASNERAVLGVLRALAQPVQLNHTRPEYVADVYAQWTKSDRAAGQTAVALARDVVPLKMLPTARGIQQVLDAVSEQVPVAATASPTDFFDDSYVKRLEAEGFYDHLGAS